MNVPFKKLQLLVLYLCLHSLLQGQDLVTSIKMNLQRQKDPTAPWTSYKTYNIDTYSDGTVDPSEDELTLYGGSTYRFQATVKYKGKTILPSSTAYKFKAKVGSSDITPIQAKGLFYQFDYATQPWNLPVTAILKLSLKPSQQREVLTSVIVKIVEPPVGDVADRMIPYIFTEPPFLQLTVLSKGLSTQVYEPTSEEEPVIVLRAGTDYELLVDVQENDLQSDKSQRVFKRWNEKSNYTISKTLGESSKNTAVRLENSSKSNRAFYLRISQTIAPGRTLVVPLEIVLNEPGKDPKPFKYQLVIQN